MKLTKNNPIVKVSNFITKNGKIKGKSKKETKALRLICPHHKINKKGKVKPSVWNDGTGQCTCESCSRSFRTKLFSDEEIDKLVDDVIEVADQGEFMAVSVDAGEESINAFAELKLAVVNVRKAYKRVRDMAKKQEKVHGKHGKHGKDNGGNSSESLGSWRAR